MTFRARTLVTLAFLSLLQAAVTADAVSAQSTFETTTKGAMCEQNATGARLCTYRVGKDLEFSIAGVGEPDAGISFIRSDFAGDFYARMGMQHRCVIVSPGKRAPKTATLGEGYFAFVSPRTGLVYRTWPECEKAR